MKVIDQLEPGCLIHQFWNGVFWEFNSKLGVMTPEKWESIKPSIKISWTTPWRIVEIQLKESS